MNDIVKLQKRLTLFQKAYKMEQLRERKSDLMEEILHLEARLRLITNEETNQSSILSTTSPTETKKKIKFSFNESDLKHSDQYDIVYVDAGISNNGIKGKQRITIAAFDEQGSKIFVEAIGNKTNNEGEISVIIRVLEIAKQMKKPIKICSDSQVAIGWATRGKVKDRKLVNQLALARKAHQLLTETQSRLQWIPREYNKAGHYLENEFNI